MGETFSGTPGKVTADEPRFGSEGSEGVPGSPGRDGTPGTLGGAGIGSLPTIGNDGPAAYPWSGMPRVRLAVAPISASARKVGFRILEPPEKALSMGIGAKAA